MLPKYSHKKDQGFVVVGALGIMIFAGIFGLIGTSMIATTGATHADNVGAAQAFAIANAGAEWYMGQLKTDTNWANETTLTRPYDVGFFTITIQSDSATEVTFRSTATVFNASTNLDVTRYVSMTAQKVPPAFKFAVYQGDDPGADLTVSHSGLGTTTVAGDMWSRGSVHVNSTNRVTGKIYIPDTETVSGTGTYTAKQIQTPYPSIPTLDTSPYIDQVTQFDSIISSNLSVADLTITGSYVLSGQVERRDIRLSGNVNITGDGVFVANRDINLHGSNGLGAVTLTITPSPGGSITLLAGRNILIGSNNDNPTIIINSGCIFYARNQPGTGRTFQVRGGNTTISNAMLYVGRNFYLTAGAQIQNSTVFLNAASSPDNNQIRIQGDTTDITSFSGALLSISQMDQAISISQGGNSKIGAVFSGLIYANEANTGACFLRDSTITGSVVCERFFNNAIVNTNITYSSSAVSNAIPAGFEGSVSTKDNSWNGL